MRQRPERTSPPNTSHQYAKITEEPKDLTNMVEYLNTWQSFRNSSTVWQYTTHYVRYRTYEANEFDTRAGCELAREVVNMSAPEWLALSEAEHHHQIVDALHELERYNGDLEKHIEERKMKEFKKQKLVESILNRLEDLLGDDEKNKASFEELRRDMLEATDLVLETTEDGGEQDEWRS